DSSLNTDDNTYNKSTNNNHRFNLNLIYTIDSFNSIIYSPNINFQNSQSFSDDTLMSDVSKLSGIYKTNESRTMNNNTGNGYNWSNNLLWRLRFRKPGRTFSLNLNNTLSNNDRDGYSAIHSKYYNSAGYKWYERNTDYETQSSSETHNYGASISYTEPIARDKVLEVNYNHGDNRSLSDRITSNYNVSTGKYDRVIDSLTNKFENSNIYDRVGTNFRVVKKKYNYQLGFAVQETNLESNNISKAKDLVQKSTNLFPTASFNYQFARSRALRLNYRGRTNQPSATQLQDVTDISNYPYISKGNPALKQEFSNNLMLSYNNFDVITFRTLFAFLNFSNTSNRIASAIEQQPGGVQLTTPININGVYNISGNFMLGFPIKNLKGGNFNTTTRMSLNQDANMINRVKNYTKNLNVAEDLRLNYNYKEKLDLGVNASVNYNSVNYSVQSRNNNAYFTHNYSIDATYTLPKGFTLASDFDYTFYTGRTDGYNQSYAMWNASFAKELFKNKRGELKASVFDILDQNVSVYRNVGSNYIEDVQNSVLKRFFMLTFTYKLNRMGGRMIPPMIERTIKNIRVN
ncbi:MAG: outer membrane beta-barrel protein, partial [Candidatus Dadabacteria bacterium]